MSLWAIGITTVVSLAGTAVTVIGQQNAAEAAENTAAYNAKNQIEQAKQEKAVTAENARRKATEERRAIAQARAAAAGNGLAFEGTPLAVLGDTVTQLERDIQDMSFASDSRRRQLLQGAFLSTQEGANTASSLRTQAVGSAISGISSAASGGLKSSGYIKT